MLVEDSAGEPTSVSVHRTPRRAVVVLILAGLCLAVVVGLASMFQRLSDLDAEVTDQEAELSELTGQLEQMRSEGTTAELEARVEELERLALTARVPNVAGLPPEAAIAALRATGFTPVLSPEQSLENPGLVVVQQRPSGGERWTVGERVHLTLGAPGS